MTISQWCFNMHSKITIKVCVCGIGVKALLVLYFKLLLCRQYVSNIFSFHLCPVNNDQRNTNKTTLTKCVSQCTVVEA